MAPAELNLATLNAVCQTYEGRDKLVRLFQFGSRAVMGLTAGASGGVVNGVHTNARSFMVALSGARRTFRWGRELPIVLSIPQALQLPSHVDQVLDLSQKASLLMFFIIDHIGWLRQNTKGMRSGVRTIQTGLKCLMVSSLLATAYGIRKLHFQLVSDERGERQSCMLGILRNGLLAFQAAHLSRFWETSDVLVGLMGIATSIMDIAPVWPTQEEPKFSMMTSSSERKNKQAKQQDESIQRSDSADSQASTLAPLDAMSPKSLLACDAGFEKL
mmetsp:Transcript_105237/g.263555  ORF Transcript_105237/g.263555 Transcript_105237/m.263555 type:complete len:273 (-) Transcript_105237:85-903(-)